MFKNRQIGNTAVKVSELGFGAASLGNLYKKISDDEAQKTLHTALSLGINLFDTAPRYGLGLSERRVGDVLRTRAKSDYVISTKAGRILTPDRNAKVDELRYGFDTPMPFDAHYDYTYDGIMRSFEDSIQRLGLAEIDILLVHDIGVDTHGDKDSYYYQQLISGGYKALDELRQQGLIKAVGLGVNETEVCERVMGLGQFDCFLLAGRYSLLEQDALDSFLPKCQQYGASIILGGPYNSGILATGVQNGGVPHYNYEPAPTDIITKVSKIEDICKEFAVPLAAAALQFPLGHDAVATVIPGMGSESRVSKTVELFKHEIPDEFWSSLIQAGLLREDAPLPNKR
ncbi:pyridoxal 4-dehydrogenase [Pseudoalteromonas sp. A601]|uniref:aldo/keto reductase n=1 Tax=Pseudoalteromonas sp. A601 TaxID=1967839 RepID=UPI000B3C1241|nr:aldo/keto reductase [Pseudoalteromonas sp. A601]OUS72914.1 pyridoxal 4-dehydrogenase [Pseudoalteromonas sp. A601]